MIGITKNLFIFIFTFLYGSLQAQTPTNDCPDLLISRATIKNLGKQKHSFELNISNVGKAAFPINKTKQGTPSFLVTAYFSEEDTLTKTAILVQTKRVYLEQPILVKSDYNIKIELPLSKAKPNFDFIIFKIDASNTKECSAKNNAYPFSTLVNKKILEESLVVADNQIASPEIYTPSLSASQKEAKESSKKETTKVATPENPTALPAESNSTAPPTEALPVTPTLTTTPSEPNTCVDVIIKNVEIIKVKPSNVKCKITIQNIGTKEINLYGDKNGFEDNLAWRVYLSGDRLINRGDIPTGGEYILKAPNKGILRPNETLEIETKVETPKKTKFTQVLVFKVDSTQYFEECNETNNDFPILIK
jgi:hypothetical protein